MTIEHRNQAAALASAANEDSRQLIGYAALYNVETVVGDFFREKIAPGAFDDCLAGNPDVRALFNHEDEYVLGRTAAGTLRLSSDAKGLRCEIDLPETSLGNDLHVLVKRGDVNQMSFGFICRAEAWEDPATPGALPLRTILKADLVDVSPVTFPQYEETELEARARATLAGRPADTERRAALQGQTEPLRLRVEIAEASRPRNAA